MPLLDLADPKVITFLLENYEKESLLRMRWVNLHKDKIKECATYKREVKNYTPADIAEASITAGLEATKRDHVVAASHRLKRAPPEYLQANVDNVRKLEPAMLPVKEETKKLMFESRKVYLKMRNKEAPEDRYYFMEAVNWKYGWKLNESELKMRGPTHAKVCHMLHNMQSRVGPQRDPDHYASPDTNLGLCNGI